MSDEDGELVPLDEGRLRSWLEKALRTFGAIAGIPITAAVGPYLGTIASATLSELLVTVGLGVHDRLLVPLQQWRSGLALLVLMQRVHEREAAGDAPRDDGFFDAGPDGRVDAAELLEGTLLTAADAYEARKVPFIGRLFANLAFDTTVSPAHAHFLLRLADRLTYHQLAVLAFFDEAQSGEYERALIAIPAEVSQTGSTPNPALITELDDLANARLVGGRQNDGSVAPTYATREGAWGPTNLVRVALMPDGETLHRLMDLGALPRADLDAVLAELRGGP